MKEKIQVIAKVNNQNIQVIENGEKRVPIIRKHNC